MTTAPLRVAVLASGRGSNLGALLQARTRGELPVEFVLVGSDKADAGALTLARDAGIPTLALDPRRFPDRVSFDHALFERIRRHADGRTVVLITHRLASVRFADRIYVLDHGRVAESGTHDDLLAAGGGYADLYRLQASAFRAGPAPALRTDPQEVA